MTREEYISNLISVKEMNVDYIPLQDCLGIIADALIFLLNNQTSTEDTIRRQAVIDVIEREQFKGDAISEIEKLPSVNPQEPKMGKWIKHDTGHSVYYDCSLCGCAAPCTETADKMLWKMANYCPDCGEKMENNGERWVEVER